MFLNRCSFNKAFSVSFKFEIKDLKIMTMLKMKYRLNLKTYCLKLKFASVLATHSSLFAKM